MPPASTSPSRVGISAHQSAPHVHSDRSLVPNVQPCPPDAELGDACGDDRMAGSPPVFGSAATCLEIGEQQAALAFGAGPCIRSGAGTEAGRVAAGAQVS